MAEVKLEKYKIWLKNNLEKYRHNLKVIETGRATPRIEAEVDVYEIIEGLVARNEE